MAMKSKKQQEPEQPKTRYDRKMEARRKQAAKDKAASIAARTTLIVILLAILGTGGYFLTTYIIKNVKATKDPYVKIGDHELSQVEYEYYYNASVNTYINNYGSFLSYMGLDTSLPYDEQDYSEDMTWKEYFEQTTLTQLSQELALYDDAKAKGFEYDTTEDYEQFLADAKDSAKSGNTTLASYIKSSFGEFATLNRIKPYVERTYYTGGYYKQLLEDNAPTDEEVDSYYQEHQTEYDPVTYYSFTLNEMNYTEDTDDISSDDADTTEADNTDTTEADTGDADSTDTTEADTGDANSTDTTEADTGDEDNTDTTEADTGDEDNTDTTEADTGDEDNTDTTEADTTTSTDTHTAKADAEAMYDRVKAGEDFEALCYEYAPASAKESYNTGESEYSLTTDATSTTINSAWVDWLYDDSRKEGDITLISDDELGVYYILKFVSKRYDESCKETISSNRASDATDEYITALSESYTATDIKGEIGYLSKSESTEETTEETTSESVLNTDIIE